MSSQISRVRLTAWSLMDQKSSAEQWRAKSQASATGCAPSPPPVGSAIMKASRLKVLCTCRSPNRICLGRLTPISPAAERCPSARELTSEASSGVSRGSPAPQYSPRLPEPSQ